MGQILKPITFLPGINLEFKKPPKQGEKYNLGLPMTVLISISISITNETVENESR